MTHPEACRYTRPRVNLVLLEGLFSALLAIWKSVYFTQNKYNLKHFDYKNAVQKNGSQIYPHPLFFVTLCYYRVWHSRLCKCCTKNIFFWDLTFAYSCAIIYNRGVPISTPPVIHFNRERVFIISDNRTPFLLQLVHPTSRTQYHEDGAF